jgi:hypothetical protein
VDQLWLIYKCVGQLTEQHEQLKKKDRAMAAVRAPASFELDPLDRKYPQVSPPRRVGSHPRHSNFRNVRLQTEISIS